MEKPVKILCVTGNPENQQSLSDLLQTESAFKTQVASSLSEALALAGQRAFDAVLLDLDLPDSQGLETLQSFQQAAPDVPLIVIGRHEAEGTAAVRAGAHDVVIPGDVSSSTLARILHDAILRQELRRTLEASKAGTQALLKANPDGILVVDQEGIVRQGNLTAERILGRPLEDLVGKPLGYPLDSTSPTEWTVLH
ncbi:MAG TPA: response regulator, partial [Chloroflexi bacterium]|nr:response regulator [Chloroflexota bacterium]